MTRRHGHLLDGYGRGPDAASQVTSEADCDEAIIGSLASNILLLETDDRNRLLYTVAGSAVERAIGSGLRGTSFLDHWDPRDHGILQDYCHRALSSHRPLCLLSFCGARSFTFETVLVPVTMSGTARKRFIGFCMPRDAAPRATPLHRVQHLTHIGFVRDELTAVADDARS